MGSKKVRLNGLTGPLTFKKVGMLLLIAFLIFGGIWLAMRSYQVQVEKEYQNLGALMISQKASKGDMERFEEIYKRYWDVCDITYHGFAWIQQRVGVMAVASGVGLFLWLLTLLQKGIISLIKKFP